MKCRKCGQELEKGAKFCVACGTRPRRPLYKRWWFWMIMGLVTWNTLIFSLILAIGLSADNSDAPTNNQEIYAPTENQQIVEVEPTEEPTEAPTEAPTEVLAEAPTEEPTEAPTQATEPPDPYADAIVVTAKELYSAYDNNEIAAEKKYTGQQIKLTGTIDDIGLDILNDAYITLDCGQYILSVQCYFEDDQLDAVAELQKGQSVTLVGICKGLTLNIIVKDCVVIS